MEAVNFHFDKVIRPLAVLCDIFCLPIPGSSDTKISYVFLTYAIVCISAEIAGLVWNLSGDRILSDGNAVASTKYFEMIILCLIVLTNIVSIIWSVIVRRKNMITFAEKIEEIDTNLDINKEFTKKKYHFFLFEVILLHVFVISCIVYESWTNINAFGFYNYQYCLIFYLNLYMVTLTVLKIYHFSMALKYRFSVLNKKLLAYRKNIFITVFPDKTHSINHFSYFRKNHLILCELITLMSRAFGAQVLCITMLIITFIVRAFNMAVNYGNLHSSYATQLIFVCIWDTGLFIVFAIMMAASCEQTIEEKNKSQKICHKLLIQLPVHLSKHQEMLKQEFRLFSKQIEQQEVKFTAVGFFNVDHTLLLTIFGSIASYVIILMQFF